MPGAQGSTIRLLLGPGARQIGAALPVFLIYPLVARFLDDAELGVWTLIGAAGFALVLMDLGLSTAVRRAAVVDDDPLTRRLIGFTLFVITALLPIAGFLYWFVLLDFSDTRPALRSEANQAAGVMFIGAIAGAWATPYRDYNYAKGAADLVAKTRMIDNLTKLALTAIGFALGFGVIVPAVAASVGACTVLVVLVRNARRIDAQVPFTPKLKCSWKEIRSAFRDGLAALVIHVAVVMSLRVDYWVLNWSEKERAIAQGLSETEATERALSSVGRYGLAGLVIGQAYNMTKQAITVLMRRLGRSDERSEALRVGTVLFGAIIFSGLSAVMLVGQPFLVLLLGDKASGENVLLIVTLLSVASMVMASYQVASDMVMLGGRTAWSCALPIAIGSVVNLAISVGGALEYGIWAVAGSTIVGNVVTALLMWWAASRIVDWKRSDVLNTTLPLFAALVPSLALAWLLRPWSVNGAWQSLLSCVLVFGLGMGLMTLTARGLWKGDGAKAEQI